MEGIDTRPDDSTTWEGGVADPTLAPWLAKRLDGQLHRIPPRDARRRQRSAGRQRSGGHSDRPRLGTGDRGHKPMQSSMVMSDSRVISASASDRDGTLNAHDDDREQNATPSVQIHRMGRVRILSATTKARDPNGLGVILRVARWIIILLWVIRPTMSVSLKKQMNDWNKKIGHRSLSREEGRVRLRPSTVLVHIGGGRRGEREMRSGMGVVLWFLVMPGGSWAQPDLRPHEVELDEAEEDAIDNLILEEFSLDERLKVQTKAISLLGSGVMEAPGTVILISPDQVERSTASNLTEALERFVPGFDAREQIWVNTMWGFRGLMTDRAENVLLNVNGEMQNLQGRDGVVGEAMLGLMDDVGQVQIISGPGSVVHGMGALAGVVDLQLKDGWMERPYQFKASVGSHLDMGVESAVVFPNGSASKRFRLSGGFRMHNEQSDGYRGIQTGYQQWEYNEPDFKHSGRELGPIYRFTGVYTDDRLRFRSWARYYNVTWYPGYHGSVPNAAGETLSRGYFHRNLSSGIEKVFELARDVELQLSLGYTTSAHGILVGADDILVRGCPPNSRRNGDRCVMPIQEMQCQSGYTLEGTDCVTAMPAVEEGGISQCPGDAFEDDGACVHRLAPTLGCPAGWTQEGDECVNAMPLSASRAGRGDIRESLAESRYRARTDLVVRAFEDHAIALGAEYRYDQLGFSPLGDHQMHTDEHPDNQVDDQPYTPVGYNNLGLFGEYQLKILPVRPVLGARYDLHTYAWAFSPRAALVYVSPGKHHAVRAVYQVAYRNDSGDKFEPDRFGATPTHDSAPARNRSVELGYNLATGHLLARIVGYRNWVNLTTWDVDRDRQLNTEFETQGFEISGLLQLRKTEVQLSHAFVHLVDLPSRNSFITTATADNNADLHLQNFMENITRLQIVQRFDPVKLTLTARYWWGLVGREQAAEWKANPPGGLRPSKPINVDLPARDPDLLYGPSLKLDFNAQYVFGDWRVGLDLKNIAALFGDSAKAVHTFSASDRSDGVFNEAQTWLMDTFHARLYLKLDFGAG